MLLSYVCFIKRHESDLSIKQQLFDSLRFTTIAPREPALYARAGIGMPIVLYNNTCKAHGITTLSVSVTIADERLTRFKLYPDTCKMRLTRQRFFRFFFFLFIHFFFRLQVFGRPCAHFPAAASVKNTRRPRLL